MKQGNIKLVAMAREERQATLESELRAMTREWIEEMVGEELDAALGIERYGRSAQRRGYRKGLRKRRFTTSNGRHELQVPRGAYFEPGPDGTKEWRSELVPRYARRTEEVEDAIVASYLCGANTRKVSRALSPLLEGAELSRSTISRIVDRLDESFEAWRRRDLSEEDIAIIYLDGFMLKVRCGGRVERMPVMCALGVRSDGHKVLLSLALRSSESEEAWASFVDDLAQRGVRWPILAVIDGNKGLCNAVKNTWPKIDVQRCTKHKLENLATHAPKRCYDEIKADYHDIVYAKDGKQARVAYQRFVEKWRRLCPDVVKSLDEAGDELLTFYRYPKIMWKALQTTNGIERINEEFRRRVKTQSSLPNAQAGLKLLYGLFLTGMISLRRINGWRELPQLVERKRAEFGMCEKRVDVAA